MSWATSAEVQTLALQIAGDNSLTLPAGWTERLTQAVAETKALIQQALGLRGFAPAALDNAVNLKGLHLDLAVYRLFSATISLEEADAAGLNRLDRSAELDDLLPLDATGSPVSGAALESRDIPFSSTAARERAFGEPSKIAW